jgi:hypothetical protein
LALFLWGEKFYPIKKAPEAKSRERLSTSGEQEKKWLSHFSVSLGTIRPFLPSTVFPIFFKPLKSLNNSLILTLSVMAIKTSNPQF